MVVLLLLPFSLKIKPNHYMHSFFVQFSSVMVCSLSLVGMCTYSFTYFKSLDTIWEILYMTIMPLEKNVDTGCYLLKNKWNHQTILERYLFFTLINTKSIDLNSFLSFIATLFILNDCYKGTHYRLLTWHSVLVNLTSSTENTLRHGKDRQEEKRKRQAGVNYNRDEKRAVICLQFSGTVVASILPQSLTVCDSALWTFLLASVAEQNDIHSDY